MTTEASAKFNFWQVILSSVITGLFSISVALISTYSESRKANDKFQTLQETNRQLVTMIKLQGDSLTILRNSITTIQLQINQKDVLLKNVNGSNFNGGQTNNGTLPKPNGK